MPYKITRHLWLQTRGTEVLASNISTGRRALLDRDGLNQLFSYRGGKPLEQDELSRRLLDADLLVDPDAPSTDSILMTEIMDAVDKFLANRSETTRSKVRRTEPDPARRLEQCYDILHQLIIDQVGPSRVARGIDLVDLKALFSHLRTFASFDQANDPGYDYCPGLLEMMVGRPLPNVGYEQQACTPETTQKRVERAAELLGPEGGRCLMLGDDDLQSLCWSLSMSFPCDVFELDQELLKFLTPRLQSATQVEIHSRDLMGGLPEEFHARYDVIMTDPMYERQGMDRFLACCKEGLSVSNPAARVMLTTRPDMIEGGHELEARIEAAGLRIVERRPDFTRYYMPGFSRHWVKKSFQARGVSPQLLQGLTRVPYLYAELLELAHA